MEHDAKHHEPIFVLCLVHHDHFLKAIFFVFGVETDRSHFATLESDVLRQHFRRVVFDRLAYDAYHERVMVGSIVVQDFLHLAVFNLHEGSECLHDFRLLQAYHGPTVQRLRLEEDLVPIYSHIARV